MRIRIHTMDRVMEKLFVGIGILGQPAAALHVRVAQPATIASATIPSFHVQAASVVVVMLVEEVLQLRLLLPKIFAGAVAVFRAPIRHQLREVNHQVKIRAVAVEKRFGRRNPALNRLHRLRHPVRAMNAVAKTKTVVDVKVDRGEITILLRPPHLRRHHIIHLLRAVMHQAVGINRAELATLAAGVEQNADYRMN